MNIIDRVTELQLAGVEKKKIIANLVLEDFSAKDIAAAFPATERKSFREDYYDFLVGSLPSDEEAEAFIRAYDGITPNQIKHIPAFVRDAQLVRRAAEAVSPSEEEEAEAA